MHEYDPTDEYVLMARAGRLNTHADPGVAHHGAGRALERTDARGRVAPGLDADLVVLAADPAADVKTSPRCAAPSAVGSSSMPPTERNKLEAMRRPGGKVPLTERAEVRPNHALDYAVACWRAATTPRGAQAEAKRARVPRACHRSGARRPGSMNKVNDARYGQNFVAHRARRGQGPARIRNQSAEVRVDPGRHRRGRARARRRRTSWAGPGHPGPEIRSGNPQRLEGKGATGQIFAIPGLFNGSYPRCSGGRPRGRRRRATGSRAKALTSTPDAQ